MTTPIPSPDPPTIPSPSSPSQRADNASRQVRGWVALLLVFSGLMLMLFAWRASRETRPTVTVTSSSDPPTRPVLTEFQLADQMATPFDSKSLQGKYWLASFFFTNCPSVCVNLNNKVQELQREFPAPGLEFVSITCDPGNDTSTRLYEYSKRFNADPSKWHFLTGDVNYIRRVAKDFFQVSVTGLTHSDRLILVDPQGQTVGTYSTSDPSDFITLKRKLKSLLAAKS